jgi:hypothetical protein
VYWSFLLLPFVRVKAEKHDRLYIKPQFRFHTSWCNSYVRGARQTLSKTGHGRDPKSTRKKSTHEYVVPPRPSTIPVEVGKGSEREKERERGREAERQRDRETERDSEKEKERETPERERHQRERES